ncbi:cupin domain-containing protein [Paenibacillus sp. Soil522]|uniref:cupin domain-containing protein n=1 Tax=Paenibacillus sp. Soil522 TaxID=1736388 RepID=UPI00138F0230|nr:cupin domain-containing protein [Paenibacillus sp. Soil522]
MEEVEVTDIVGGLLLKKLEIGFHFRVAEPGWTYPDHYHKIFEILCYDGSAVQYIEGRSIAFGRGDWLVIPPGMRHHIVNSGPSDCTYLSIHLDDDLDFSPMVSNPTQ